MVFLSAKFEKNFRWSMSPYLPSLQYLRRSNLSFLTLRPCKLSDFCTLSQTKLLENHILHSGTYLWAHIWYYPPVYVLLRRKESLSFLLLTAGDRVSTHWGSWLSYSCERAERRTKSSTAWCHTRDSEWADGSPRYTTFGSCGIKIPWSPGGATCEGFPVALRE